VIKNIDSATTEPDVIALFQIFSIQTESKIVGITVSANRGIAFVDYDAAAPVLKAVEQHNKEPMQIRGRVLEIYQKTLEQRARRGGGGGGSGGGGGRGFSRGGGQSSGEGDVAVVGNNSTRHWRPGDDGGGGDMEAEAAEVFGAGRVAVWTLKSTQKMRMQNSVAISDTGSVGMIGWNFIRSMLATIFIGRHYEMS
jgi:hypothetical protein